jgi:hypothetical protein
MEYLVSELCARWWYALPAWPPADFSYKEALVQAKLRNIEGVKFKSEPDLDSKQFLKVQEIDFYPGVFKDPTGKLHDLRPKDTCPSYSNFKKMEIKELQAHLLKAYKEQLKHLVAGDDKKGDGENTEEEEGVEFYDKEIGLANRKYLRECIKRLEMKLD